jgi:hypothetical protein
MISNAAGCAKTSSRNASSCDSSFSHQAQLQFRCCTVFSATCRNDWSGKDGASASTSHSKANGIPISCGWRSAWPIRYRGRV